MEYILHLPFLLLLFFIALFLIGLLVLLIVEPLIELSKEKIWKNKQKHILTAKMLVKEHSVLCQKIRELNSQTKYFTEILDDGCSQYTVYANSLSKYRHLTPEMALQDFLLLNKDSVLCALKQVQMNQVIYEVYEKNFNAIPSTATEDDAKSLGISYAKYLSLERILAQNEKLNIVRDYSISCVVSYTSPAGVNSYEKEVLFSQEEIISTLSTMSRQQVYFQSEQFRRKNERAKVTPSLRYDVMRRDDFRCRLCGRSARDGVELEVDHIVPISKGGSSIESNLQTLCRDCNRGKSAKM